MSSVTPPNHNAFRTKSLTIARDIFAGSVGGIAVTLVGHPFDTLKVRMQTSSLYKGLVDCFLKTISWEGPLGLYKGVSSPLTGQIFFRANMFLGNAQAQRFLSNNGAKKLTVLDYYLAGGFAWTFGTLFECPIDVVKSQLQVQLTKAKTIPGYVAPFNGMVECAKVLVKENGFFGLYQGVLPHVMRNLPAGSVHLGTFELVRHYFADKNHIPTSQLSAYHNLIAGGVGGFLYWFIFFPIDVVKSSMQTDSIKKSERKFTGVIDCSKKLYQEGGPKRFYRGFAPCLLRSIPANALMLWSVAYITDKIKIN